MFILSGSSDPEKFARARQLGAPECFVKGPDLAPLLERIRALLPLAEPLRQEDGGPTASGAPV